MTFYYITNRIFFSYPILNGFLLILSKYCILSFSINFIKSAKLFCLILEFGFKFIIFFFDKLINFNAIFHYDCTVKIFVFYFYPFLKFWRNRENKFVLFSISYCKHCFFIRGFFPSASLMFVQLNNLLSIKWLSYI